MRVIFVLRSTEAFAVFLRFVLPWFGCWFIWGIVCMLYEACGRYPFFLYGSLWELGHGFPTIVLRQSLRIGRDVYRHFLGFFPYGARTPQLEDIYSASGIIGYRSHFGSRYHIDPQQCDHLFCVRVKRGTDFVFTWNRIPDNCVRR